MRRAILGPTLTALGTDSSLTSASINSCVTALTDSRITSACSSRKTSRTTCVIVILS